MINNSMKWIYILHHDFIMTADTLVARIKQGISKIPLEPLPGCSINQYKQHFL